MGDPRNDVADLGVQIAGITATHADYLTFGQKAREKLDGQLVYHAGKTQRNEKGLNKKKRSNDCEESIDVNCGKP